MKAIASTVAIIASLSNLALAQYREDAPPVVSRPDPPPVQDPQPSIIHAFARDYQSAGRPRMVLFWSVAFDDTLDVERRHVSRKDRSESGTSNNLDKNTAGAAGSSTLRDGDFTNKRSEVVEDRTIYSDPSKHSMPFSPRDAIELKQGFLFAMRQGGVTFVDRDVIVRTSSVALNSKDTKSLETHAALKDADYILEILPVKDDRAPTRIAFSVSLKNLKKGTETASSYIHGVPWMPRVQSTYVPTDRGFELRASSRPAATMHDIGMAIAIDVMRTIGPPIGGRM